MRTALLACLLAVAASAQDQRPALPRVLLIGDSISIGYTKFVQQALSGKAVVLRNRGNAGPSSRGVESIDEWLQTDGGAFDVIHFNHGLHDLAYRNADGRGLNKKDGKRWATLDEYRQNLETIVGKLKATGAELIFATTTPVPEGEKGRVVGDDLKFNAVATEVMREAGIGINDLHAAVAHRMSDLATKPGNVHFKATGSRLLAKQVAHAVTRALLQRDSAKRRLWSEAKKPQWQPTRKIRYRTIGEVDLALHVFEPNNHRNTDRHPAIVFFFGGGWNGGTPAQFYPYADYLAGRGMVAIAAEYRVKSRNGTSPYECVEDGKAAVRFVRANAISMGIDPARVAAGGGSAGGHVAAATGSCPGFEADGEPVPSRPHALVLFNPVYDNGPGGYGHGRLGARWREISPLHNISKSTPPTLTFLGSKDSLIPVATGERFRDASREAGCRSELVVYDGRGHGFFNHGRGDGRDYRDTVRRMDAFLASLGFLSGAPTLNP